MKKNFSRLFFCILIGGVLISCFIVNRNISLSACSSIEDGSHILIDDVSMCESSDNTNNEEVKSEVSYNNHLNKYSNLMPLEHLLYLEQLCNERNLDFELAIAIIKTESDFDHSVISNKDYGYFQINSVNHERLSKKLNTPINPLDPYVNINWGTYMLTDILNRWANVDGLSNSEIERCALSEYNKGYTGFMKHGEATGYISRVEKSKEFIRSL